MIPIYPSYSYLHHKFTHFTMPSPAYAPASSITPTTPIRPPPLSSSDSPSLPPLTPDSHTPTQVSSTQSPPTPNTPLSPAPSSFLTQSSRRKSTASISSRRKPVQANIGLEGDYEIALNEIRTHRRSLDTASMMDMAMTPTTASTDPFSDPGFTSSTPTATPSSAGPPRYVLEVAPLPPTYHYDLNGPYSFRPHTHPSAYIESGLSGPSAQSTREQLPIYAEDVQTEPDTLARKCWVWGFLFPVLWLIGMAM